MTWKPWMRGLLALALVQAVLGIGLAIAGPADDGIAVDDQSSEPGGEVPSPAGSPGEVPGPPPSPGQSPGSPAGGTPPASPAVPAPSGEPAGPTDPTIPATG